MKSNGTRKHLQSELSRKIGKELSSVSAKWTECGYKSTISHTVEFNSGNAAGDADVIMRCTGDGEFTDYELSYLAAILEDNGHFANLLGGISRNKRILEIKASYTIESAPKVKYGEVTLARLLALVKEHPQHFPDGMNTKIAFSDFDDNEYHTKAEITSDSGMIHFAYEKYEYRD